MCILLCNAMIKIFKNNHQKLNHNKDFNINLDQNMKI